VGTVSVNCTPVALPIIVLVNVIVVSCDEPGENVCNPVGASTDPAGATLSVATS